MNINELLKMLCVSEIDGGFGPYDEQEPNKEEIARQNNPAVKEAYEELLKAQKRYDLILKLVLTTDRF